MLLTLEYLLLLDVTCLLYTSDAADEELTAFELDVVSGGGRRSGGS